MSRLDFKCSDCRLKMSRMIWELHDSFHIVLIYPCTGYILTRTKPLLIVGSVHGIVRPYSGVHKTLYTLTRRQVSISSKQLQGNNFFHY